MNISTFSKTGTYHLQNGGENQDYLLQAETGDAFAIMLADGATACGKGLCGARLACEAANQIILRDGVAFFRYPKEKIAFLLTEQILYFLEQNKGPEEDIREYGSTFSMAFMEKNNGRITAVNLGDGAVFTNTGDGCSCLLKPKRFRGNPCLTTTEGAAKAIEITKCQMAYGDSLLLCSDGLLNQIKKGNIAAMMRADSIDGINQELASAENEDDCSYISFTRTRK